MRLLASIFLLCGVALVAAGPTGVVMTKSGPVRGLVEDGGVHVFRGIPFGADTGGQNRFKPPQPVQPWTKVRDCFAQTSICPQIRITDGIFLGKEDCLYLDVYVPPNAKNTSNLPVLFWIYGGGYSFGDGYEFGFYDGKNVAKKRNAVIVTHNYRLATLGFLALDQLKAENADRTTGNYGLQDQQAAMRWVRDNIAAFGGNPNQVTIFGESAGGFSVCWHLVSPTSRALFGSAIIESGSCDAKEFFRAYPDAVSWSQTFAASVDCDPKKVTDLVGCLRKVPTGKIIGHLMAADRHQQLMSMRGIHSGAGFVPALYPLMPWGPAIDGSNAGLLDTPIKLIQAKQWAAVPTIMGFNADEGSIFIIGIPFIVPGVLPPLTPATLNKTLNYFFPNNTYVMNNIWTLYPAYEWKHTDGQAAAILRDYFFACGNRRALREMKRASGTNVWMYHFTYKGDWIEDPILGDYHSAELEYVWANPWPPIIHMFSERDHKMSDTFGTFWSNLAAYRDPNGKGTPYVKWPVYDFDGARQNLVMDVPAGLEANLFGDRCDFWDKVGPSLQVAA